MENRSAAVRRQTMNPAWSAGIANKALTALACLGVGTVLLGGAVLYQVAHQPAPIVLASSGAGDLVPLRPLSEPLVEPRAVMLWAQECAVRAYDIDFLHYRQQQIEARRCFEVPAWNSWVESFMGNMAAIIEKELHAKLDGVPGCPTSLVGEGMLGDRYAWKVRTYLRVTWTNTRDVRERTYQIDITAARTEDPAFPRRIAIRQFVAKDHDGRC